LACDALAFDGPAVISTFPVTNVPAVSDANYLSLLFSVPHCHFPFLLRSRAATASFAIRLRSLADNFAALAFPPLLAMSAIAASERVSARLFPPRLPSACACGFGLFFPILTIILLTDKQVKRICNLIAVFSKAIHPTWANPRRSERIFQVECTGFVPLVESAPGCDCESKIPALATV